MKGRGPGSASNEKAKNFKSAIARLFKELKIFKVFISIALVLAVVSSILSIFAPNKLSDLTNEISKGLVVNNEKITELTTTMNITKSMDMSNIILKNITIDGINVTIQDQMDFLNLYICVFISAPTLKMD